MEIPFYVPNALKDYNTHQKYHHNNPYTTTQVLNIEHQEHDNMQWRRTKHQYFLKETQLSCNISWYHYCIMVDCFT